MRIGIMSFAHMHAYAYADCLSRLPNAELAAVWDDDSARGEEAAMQFATRFVDDQTAFLKSGLDAVIVTSENIKHRAMVEAARAAVDQAELENLWLEAKDEGS